MKSDQIYQHLLDVAEKVELRVSEENLRRAGAKAKSGLCRVHGSDVFIMDKKATVREKVALLAACLTRWPLDDIYIVPTVREVIQKYEITGTDARSNPESQIKETGPEGDVASGEETT